jgi:hypothetical protein
MSDSLGSRGLVTLHSLLFKHSQIDSQISADPQILMYLVNMRHTLLNLYTSPCVSHRAKRHLQNSHSPTNTSRSSLSKGSLHAWWRPRSPRGIWGGGYVIRRRGRVRGVREEREKAEWCVLSRLFDVTVDRRRRRGELPR